jgi:hypothetical protein
MPIMESLLNQAKNVDVLSTAKCPKDRQEKSVQRSTYPIRRFLPRGCNLRNTDVPSSSSVRGGARRLRDGDATSWVYKGLSRSWNGTQLTYCVVTAIATRGASRYSVANELKEHTIAK